MPYSGPTTTTTTTTSPRNHRRSWSSPRFSTERTGPGAFAPIANLPRRSTTQATTTRPMFQFPQDSDSDDNDVDIPVTFPSSSPPLPSPPLPRRAPGKPLRPSLKSSSSPQLLLPVPPSTTPTTPSPKNVHFNDATSVKVFRSAAKPVSISRDNGTETETETDQDSSSPSFPFPFVSSPPVAVVLAPPPLSSPVPAPPLPPPATFVTPHILLSSIALSPASTAASPALTGSVLVRNVAFEKHVAVRFTLDDWRTTSEVTARYSAPARLPDPWPTDPHPYDTFTFSISLHAATLRPRVLYLAVRLTAAGAEWWDNNHGGNYRLAFRPAPPPSAPPRPTRPPMHPRSLSSPARHTTSTVPFPSSSSSPPTTSLDTITKGTGFSSFTLPSTPPTPTTLPPTRLTLRNYAVPKPQRHKDSPLPTPPASRSSSFSDLPSPPPSSPPPSPPRISPPSSPPPHRDTYATLLARWCFATSGPAAGGDVPRALAGDGRSASPLFVGDPRSTSFAAGDARRASLSGDGISGGVGPERAWRVGWV